MYVFEVRVFELRISDVTKDEQAVAVELHTRFCKSSHIDICGWDYEYRRNRPDWNAHAHNEWLRKARKLLATYGDGWRDVVVTYESVRDILSNGWR